MNSSPALPGSTSSLKLQRSPSSTMDHISDSASSIDSSPASYTSASESSLRRSPSIGVDMGDSSSTAATDQFDRKYDSNSPRNRLQSPAFLTSPNLSQTGSITPVINSSRGIVPGSPGNTVAGVGLGRMTAGSNGLGIALPLTSLSNQRRRTPSPVTERRRSISPIIARTREREASRRSQVMEEEAGLPVVRSSSIEYRSDRSASLSSSSKSSATKLSAITTASLSPRLESLHSAETPSISAESEIGSPLLRAGFSPISWADSVAVLGGAGSESRKIKRASIDGMLERNRHTIDAINAAPYSTTLSQRESTATAIRHTAIAPSSIQYHLTSASAAPPHSEPTLPDLPSRDSHEQVDDRKIMGDPQQKRLALPAAFVSPPRSTSTGASMSPELMRVEHSRDLSIASEYEGRVNSHRHSNIHSHSNGYSSRSFGTRSGSDAGSTTQRYDNHDQFGRTQRMHNQLQPSPPDSMVRRQSLTRDALARDRRQSMRSEVSSYAGSIVDARQAASGVSSPYNIPTPQNQNRFSRYLDLPHTAPSRLSSTRLENESSAYRNSPSRMSSHARSNAPSRNGKVSGQSTVGYRDEQAKEHHDQPHLVLLHSALESFSHYFWPSSSSAQQSSESIELVRSMSSLVIGMSKTNETLRGLVRSTTAARISAALDLDSLQTADTSVEMMRAEKVIKSSLRSSDEEIRALTEGLISFTRLDKERAEMRDDGIIITPERRSASRLGGGLVRSHTSTGISSRSGLRNPLEVQEGVGEDSPSKRVTPGRSTTTTSLADQRSANRLSSLGRSSTPTLSTIEARRSTNFNATHPRQNSDGPVTRYRAPSPTLSSASNRLLRRPPVSLIRPSPSRLDTSSYHVPPPSTSPSVLHADYRRNTSPTPTSGISPSTSIDLKLKGLHLVNQMNQSPTKSSLAGSAIRPVPSPTSSAGRYYMVSGSTGAGGQESQRRVGQQPMIRSLSELASLRAISPAASGEDRDRAEQEDEIRQRAARKQEVREILSRNR